MTGALGCGDALGHCLDAIDRADGRTAIFLYDQCH
jgi:hypothetical protein